MIQQLSDVLANALWVGVVLLAIQVYRAPRDVAVRYFAVGLFFLAASHALVVVQSDTTAVERLVANLFGIAAVYFQVCFFRTALRRGGRGPRLWKETAVAVAVAVIGTIGWLAAPQELRPELGQPKNAMHLPAVIFSVSIVGYYATVSARTIAWSTDLIRKLGGPSAGAADRVATAFRIALGVILVAMVLRSVSSAEKVIAEIAVFVDHSQVAHVQSLYPAFAVLADVGFVLFLIGAILPIAVGGVQTLPVMLRHRWDYRRLEPLWSALLAEYPRLPLRTRRGVSGRFYRRGLEVKDGLILLADFYDPAVAARAESESRARAESMEDRSVTVAAALVRDAIAAHRAARAVPDPYPIPTSGADDWETDMAWLVRLARTFSGDRSPGSTPTVTTRPRPSG
jgi:hypothetical protein